MGHWDALSHSHEHPTFTCHPIFLIKETVNSWIKLFTGKLMHQYAQQCSHLLIIAHNKMTSDHSHGWWVQGSFRVYEVVDITILYPWLSAVASVSAVLDSVIFEVLWTRVVVQRRSKQKLGCENSPSGEGHFAQSVVEMCAFLQIHDSVFVLMWLNY